MSVGVIGVMKDYKLKLGSYAPLIHWVGRGGVCMPLLNFENFLFSFAAWFQKPDLAKGDARFQRDR
jgi:hypothetical protein